MNTAEFPSVTQVIGPLADFSRVPPDVLEIACDRGIEVHEFAASYARGLFVDEESISPHCRGFFHSFKDWIDHHVYEVHLVERELVDPINCYKGHPDLIVIIRGDITLSLVDLKTPRVQSPLWRLQLAAYANLARKAGYDIHRVCALRLHPQGLYPTLTEYTGMILRDLNVFLSALNVWRFING